MKEGMWQDEEGLVSGSEPPKRNWEASRKRKGSVTVQVTLRKMRKT
jgi:hypothetical protein